jgi:hypothetical protein
MRNGVFVAGSFEATGDDRNKYLDGFNQPRMTSFHVKISEKLDVPIL